jgi:hypothetical protein
MRAVVTVAGFVSGVDAPPVFEAGEHVLDLVPLTVEDRIIGMLDTVLGMRRDAGRDVLPDKRLVEARGTVGPIGQQMAGAEGSTALRKQTFSPCSWRCWSERYG